MELFSLSNEQDIPNVQGIYAFYLNCITPTKLGLLGTKAFSEKQLIKAKEKLVKKIGKIILFQRSNFLKGEVCTVNKNRYLAEKFVIEACEAPPLDFLEEIERLDVKHLYSYIRLADQLSLFCQPVYIGITQKQTLYSRYSQHKYSHEKLDPEISSFGVRLRESGFEWDDIFFSCVKFKTNEDNLLVLSLLEKQLHTLSKPILSFR